MSSHPEGRSCSELGRVLTLNDPPAWGAAEFVHFVVVVNLAVGACTFVTMYFLYIVTRSQFYLFAKFSVGRCRLTKADPRLTPG